MKTRTNRTLRLCGWGILALALIAVVPAWGAIFTDIVGMPAQRATVTLSHAGAGRYRGSAQVPGSGRWDVSVVVTRANQRLGSKHLAIVVR